MSNWPDSSIRLTKRLHVETVDGRPAVLRRSNHPGYWRIEAADRVGEWVGSIWSDRPAWSARMTDVEAAAKFPQYAEIILSNPS